MDDLSKVVSQPYDVISPEEQKSLHRRHPRNIVWIDFGLEEAGDGPAANRYTRSAAYYRQWMSEGTLVRDDKPSLYYYEQEFSLPDRGTFVRKGFLGALRLSAFGEGVVFPHEKTHSRPKEDRLSLMRATEANTSPIFGLYSDPRDEVGKALRAKLPALPEFSATDDLGVAHRMWRVTDPASLAAAAGKMSDKGVFIADGHHRYETALAFRDEMRKKHGTRANAAYEHLLMFLCNMDDEGIVILPTHRGVHSLPAFSGEEFLARVRNLASVETRRGTPEDALRAIAEAGKRGKAIALSTGGDGFHIISFPDPVRFGEENLSRFPPGLRALDVVLLHGFLFEQILGISPEAVTAGQFVRYYKEARKAASDLARGDLQAVFFLNPATMDEFRNVSLSGHVLPQKTTFFYPKILTGLLIFSVRGDESLPG
ncbi:MAG TPA: DUF1015 domain-containing protein [Candidatus Deferrimicrobiaceae bacterium]|nr:DUF1015 domain-containing protein [Candidatus Deferrimicrobiaceae bacterium]